jgi:hypothetical protein
MARIVRAFLRSDPWQERANCSVDPGNSSRRALAQELLEFAVVLLRHNPSLPRISQFCGTAGTSGQALDDSADQPSVHGRDRVRDVPLRPQWRILWVGNCRVRQVAGAARWNMVLRGNRLPNP